MKYSGKLLARMVQGEVVEALSDTRVVVLNGARQVGKSTLAELVLRAQGGGAARFLATQSTAVGGLLENFVLSEIARQLTWSQVQAQLFHYRDRDQREVDGIVETYDGRVAGIEVKAAETVRNEDFRSLRHLHDRLGDRFVGGYVLYCGEHPLNFGPKMHALPISALWLAGR
jgi:predicted AAA+ superfamily ATPase